MKKYSEYKNTISEDLSKEEIDDHLLRLKEVFGCGVYIKSHLYFYEVMIRIYYDTSRNDLSKIEFDKKYEMTKEEMFLSMRRISNMHKELIVKQDSAPQSYTLFMEFNFSIKN